MDPCHFQLDVQLIDEKPYKWSDKQVISWEIVGYNIFIWVQQSNTSAISTLEEFMRKILIVLSVLFGSWKSLGHKTSYYLMKT